MVPFRPSAPVLLTIAALAAGGCGRRGTDAATLAEARDRVLDRGDVYEATRLALDLDEQSELAGGAPAADPARIARKYAILRNALREDVDHGVAPPDDPVPRVLPIAYDPRELAAVREVLTTFGELYIGLTAGEEAILAAKPWAGYWYPLAGTALFDGDDAPLVKLDRLAAALSAPGGSATWERDHHDVVPEAAWEGFCGAWATAAILTPEPLRARAYHGVVFSPGDLKALLTKAHEHYPLHNYGIRYDGDALTDGTFQDLRPEAFHRLAAHFLVEARKSVIFDGDPSIPVWNKPLYRMRWVVKADPDHADAFLVAAYPWFTRFRNAPGDAPTTEADIVSSNFEYRLYVDRTAMQDGKYLAIAGEWTGRSVNNHPDFAMVPAENGAWGSANPALEANFPVLKELLEKGTPQ